MVHVDKHNVTVTWARFQVQYKTAEVLRRDSRIDCQDSRGDPETPQETCLAGAGMYSTVPTYCTLYLMGINVYPRADRSIPHSPVLSRCSVLFYV